MRPILILVSGVPGGGKTTLARQLADHLRVPHLNKDVIRDGLWFTSRDRQRDLTPRAFELFFAVAESWLATGVSLVADQTLYRGVSEDDFSRVVSLADSVNIVVRCGDARDRFEAKMAADPRNTTESVRRMMEHWDAILADVSDPLDLGCPTLEVDTIGVVDAAAVAARAIALARSDSASE